MSAGLRWNQRVTRTDRPMQLRQGVVGWRAVESCSSGRMDWWIGHRAKLSCETNDNDNDGCSRQLTADLSLTLG